MRSVLAVVCLASSAGAQSSQDSLTEPPSQGLRAPTGKTAPDSAGVVESLAPAPTAPDPDPRESERTSGTEAPAAQDPSVPGAGTHALGDSIEVTTESMTLWLAPDGVPIAWELTDPGYTRAPVPLIESSHVVPSPLELISHLGDLPFAWSRSSDGGHEVLRFESAPSPDGLVVARTYRIPPRGFEITTTLEVDNRGPAPVDLGSVGLRLGPGLGEAQILERGLFANFYKYVWAIAGVDGGTATFAGLGLGDEVTFPDQDESLDWAGIHNRFFLLAAAPLGEEPFRGTVALAESLVGQEFVDEELVEYLPVVELATELGALPPGETHELAFALYAGPKVSEELSAGRADFGGVIFAGSWLPMRWLCHAITWVLEALHWLLGSWGLAIIALAVVIRMVVYPLYKVSLKSQARTAAAMALMKPKFAEAKERLKDDPLARDEAILAIYKEHGVSPFGSLFGNVSLVIQIPIFIALFKVVGDAYFVQGEGFLWIADLSETEKLFAFGSSVPLLGSHFNLLPFLMTATQVVSSLLSAPPAADRRAQVRQKLTMVGVGVAFFFLFYSFPAGLVLYWWMATLFASVQQRFITKRLAAQGA